MGEIMSGNRNQGNFPGLMKSEIPEENIQLLLY